MAPMNSWLKEIERATTQAQIVATARDYVSLYSSRELFYLPEDCREIRLVSYLDRAAERLGEISPPT